MAGKKIDKSQMYEREILEIIKTKALTKIQQIFSYYSGCCEATFYNNKLNELDTIKKALQDNRTKMCQSMLFKWYKGDNPTLQMAAYKILCEDEERKKLSMNYSETDITSKGEKIKLPDIIINYPPLKSDEL